MIVQLKVALRSEVKTARATFARKNENETDKTIQKLIGKLQHSKMKES